MKTTEIADFDFTQQQHAVEVPKFKPQDLSLKETLKIIGLTQPVNFYRLPVVELTARKPYTDIARLDFYKPGRWDCEVDLIFMDVIRQVGPSPGEWEGTVGYGTFKAPDFGKYIVEINFSGLNTTMLLSGPWGLKNKLSGPTSATSVVIAGATNLSKGQTLSFSFSCRGLYLGFVKSVKIYQAIQYIPFP